jgi:tetratricopeptide (TPR) repeat protein
MKAKALLLLLALGAPLAARAQSVTARNKFKIGRSMFEKGHYKEALSILDEALKEEPMFPDAQYVEGLCYIGLDDYVKARKKLEYCIGLDPSFLPAHERLGEIYLRQNDYVHAKTTFAEMAKVPHGGPAATYCLGVIAYAQKDLPGAEKQWNEALKLDPKMARARNNLGVLHQMKEQHQMALADFKGAAMLSPENPAYLLNEAFEYLALGDKAQVRILCDRIQHLSDHRVEVGFCSVALKDYADEQWAKCATFCDSALARDPDLTEALLLKARALQKQSKTEAARAAYEAALKSDPNLITASKALAAMKPPATPNPAPKK